MSKLSKCNSVERLEKVLEEFPGLKEEWSKLPRYDPASLTDPPSLDGFSFACQADFARLLTHPAALVTDGINQARWQLVHHLILDERKQAEEFWFKLKDSPLYKQMVIYRNPSNLEKNILTWRYSLLCVHCGNRNYYRDHDYMIHVLNEHGADEPDQRLLAASDPKKFFWKKYICDDNGAQECAQPLMLNCPMEHREVRATTQLALPTSTDNGVYVEPIDGALYGFLLDEDQKNYFWTKFEDGIRWNFMGVSGAEKGDIISFAYISSNKDLYRNIEKEKDVYYVYYFSHTRVMSEVNQMFEKAAAKTA